jgi:two-component system sensor histidine kinase/response regulator
MEINYIYFLSTIFLLILIIVGIYVYFKSKLAQQNNNFSKMINEEKESQKNKNALLVDMGDDIYHLSKDLVDTDKTHTDVIESEILTSANNLRELLKIQANNIDIFTEKYVFSHMLDDISTYLASNFENRNTEVVFDIDENVPRYLTGDVMHFGRIINNILEFSIKATPEGKVTLSIRCEEPLENNLILHVKIFDNGTVLSPDIMETLFELNYNDMSKDQVGPELYIAKKLTLAMGGTITVNESSLGGNTFTLQMPMQRNSDSGQHEFSAFKEGVKKLKVLIYAKKPATSDSLEKLMNYFYNDITMMYREDMHRQPADLEPYDLIILDNSYFNAQNIAYLKRLKQNKNVHIVGCNSIFSQNILNEDSVIDAQLYMPSNLERIVELITALDLVEKDEPVVPVEIIDENLIHKSDTLQIYKDVVEESKNIDIDCFTYFKGSKLLIVEDNLINQKILVSVLKKSGIEIEIANNGQEALDLLFIDQKIFDIILMDISMPVMDGLLATEYIRARDEYKDIPIVTFTAFAMGAEIEEMFNAGCNAYLTKPLNIKKLYTVFNMFLTQTKREVSLQKAIEIQG